MSAPNFESLSIDEGLDLLIAEASRLGRLQTAALFGCIGGALLPLYSRFSEANGWGDVAVLRAAVDVVLTCVAGKEDLHGISDSILESIARVTPSEDDFAVPEATFAIDAAICVDAAVRAVDPTKDIDTAWVEYTLDPAITTSCEQETGYLELGSSTKAMVWRSQALRDPVLRGAFEAVADMAKLLFRTSVPISDEALGSLQQLAERVAQSQSAKP